MPAKTLLKVIIFQKNISFAPLHARVAELVDALDSKSSDSNIVRVRFPPRALKTLAMVNSKSLA